MSIGKIEQIITDANNEAYSPLPFETGRPQDINLFSENTGGPLLWLVTPQSSLARIGTSSRFIVTYSVELFVFSDDDTTRRTIAASKEQSLEMIKDAESYATELLINIQNQADDNKVTVSGIGIVPVYKFSAKGVFTGVSLSMNIAIPDQNEYCL